ncbi:SRPBCC family protein [Rhodococcus sp. D2-41]|uniref:SRPBCC family protein n=1 Tax=Speluncibacter jeojiensis TaxID=2710754 RepID=A0A9X4RCS2_9ACTN|nr:SRPBCC family protein [Rhodococcus sp. D2-41]MDG3010923.1 SRPBCC family protein [Rhodococcus sp. D2-41]MDG3013898.1 SRPBCC family protein [Corynebacteriales bacterium D3-21]
MAVSGHAEIDIAATPEQVMDGIAAIDALPTWSSAHKSASVETTYDDGRPKRVRMAVSVMGITDEQVVEYSWEGSEKVTWTLIESTQQKAQDGSYVLTATDKGTHAAFDLTVDLKIPVPGFIVKKAQKQAIETATKGIKKFVEGR